MNKSADALVCGIMLCGKNVQRKRLEMCLIFQLSTSHPCGLNSDFSFLQAACRARTLQSFFFSFMAYANIATFPTYFVTPLMKGRDVWRKTQTKTRHFCSLFFLFFLVNIPLLTFLSATQFNEFFSVTCLLIKGYDRLS